MLGTNNEKKPVYTCRVQATRKKPLYVEYKEQQCGNQALCRLQIRKKQLHGECKQQQHQNYVKSTNNKKRCNYILWSTNNTEVTLFWVQRTTTTNLLNQCRVQTRENHNDTEYKPKKSWSVKSTNNNKEGNLQRLQTTTKKKLTLCRIQKKKKEASLQRLQTTTTKILTYSQTTKKLVYKDYNNYKQQQQKPWLYAEYKQQQRSNSTYS